MALRIQTLKKKTIQTAQSAGKTPLRTSGKLPSAPATPSHNKNTMPDSVPDFSDGGLPRSSSSYSAGDG